MDKPEELSLESVHMQHLERFTVLMYSKGCGAAYVNDARAHLFSHGLKSLDSIPPTQAALFQHAKRSLFQASYIWKQTFRCRQDIPCPSSWGWELDTKHQWIPHWTELADASNACNLLLHCSCTKACRGNCKCTRAGLRCSTLCKCEGCCMNNDL